MSPVGQSQFVGQRGRGGAGLVQLSLEFFATQFGATDPVVQGCERRCAERRAGA